MTKLVIVFFTVSMLLCIHNGVHLWLAALQALVVVKYIVRMELECDKKRL